MPRTYKSQSARDAQAANYSSERYWNYLEDHAIELHHYFMLKDDPEQAQLMLTRSLSESLSGNDGN